jgi:4-amino-4-deoxy-L-arabinose transferase-like glycosyltransferase
VFSRNIGASAAVLLLAFMAWLSFGAARRESPSFDEVAHIGAGLSYVQKFDLRLNPEHPPLSKALTGLVLTLRGVRADYDGPAWKASNDFFSAFLGQWSFGHWVIARWNDPAIVLWWARLPMLLFTLGLGWLIFRIGMRLGGVAGGLICLAVYVSAPVFLVFGPLVLTDIPIAFFSVLTVWTFAEMWERPERVQVWRFALCLAGAFLVKFSAPILLLGLICAGLSNRGQGAPRKVRWRAFGKGVLLAALVVYAVYFVLSWNQPTTSLARLGSSLPAMALRRLLMPAAVYLSGAALVLFTFGRATFLLGQAYPHGVWFFYPVVFALKSQLGFLALLALAAALAIRGRGRKIVVIPDGLQMHWRTLWVTLVVFVAVCMLSRFDISIRHFSVPLALLMLMLAPLPRLARSNALRVLIAVLAVSCLVTAVRTYPWYFPYVNALGAWRPVYTLMSDSNVDWNQALPEVERFVERHGLKDVALDNYGISDDLPYVPQSHPWDCQAPGPVDAGQWVVVSANMILDGHNCGWLLHYPQEALAGGGMYAFHLPAEIPAAGAAGGPPVESARRMFLGMPFDFKAVTLQVLRNPETIPSVVKEMSAKFAAPPK